MCAAIATPPLVVDQTICSVSAVYGSAPPGAVTPPQRSTTRFPWRWTQQAAPTSPCFSKLAANASRTGSKPAATGPPSWGWIISRKAYFRLLVPKLDGTVSEGELPYRRRRWHRRMVRRWGAANQQGRYEVGTTDRQAAVLGGSRDCRHNPCRRLRGQHALEQRVGELQRHEDGRLFGAPDRSVRSLRSRPAPAFEPDRRRHPCQRGRP